MSGAAASEVDRRTPRVRAVLAQAQMELRLLVRSGESLLVTLGIPVGVLVFFSLVAVAIQTAFERKYAVLKRLGATPLTRGDFLVAKGLAVAALLMVQTAVVLLVAAVGLGWGGGGGALLVPGLILLGAVTATALGLLLAGTLRAEATIAASNGLFLALLVVSGVTFDAAALPAPLALAGAYLPMGALGRALSTALAGDGLALAPTVSLLLWGVAAVAVGSRTFRWEP